MTRLLLCLGLAMLTGPAFSQDKKPAIPEDKDPKTTASGLVVSMLVPGKEGVPPKLGDTVKVHYTGWLTDGTVFDDSRARSEPASFVLGAVIDGWNEGLQLMTPGARAKLTIPPGIAYGSRRQGIIPPDATLIFDVELIEVIPGEPLPVYRKLDPEKATTTESGIRWICEDSGEGTPPKPDEVVVLSYAYWTDDGKMVGCSRLQGDSIKGPPSQMPLPFLKEMVLTMNSGMVLRCEVPAALAFGDRPHPKVQKGAVTSWILTLESILRPIPLPPFELPEDSKVTARPSGLKIQVIKEGQGRRPKFGEDVTVHYAGWLTDGKNFDSSYQRGEPTTFKLGQVIEGWNEGLQLMNEGGIVRLVIPAHLAYGKRGAGDDIPPDSVLVFYVELVKVQG